MSKKEHIVRYTGKELQTKQKLGEGKSDWQQAAAMTDREIEEAVASDEVEAEMRVDWSNVSIEMPRPKAVLNMRIDYDVLEFSAVRAGVIRQKSMRYCDRMWSSSGAKRMPENEKSSRIIRSFFTLWS